MEESWDRSLIWEDPTCSRATKPMHHSYWACTLEPMIQEPRCSSYWSPGALEPVFCNRRRHRNEKSMHHGSNAVLLTTARESWGSNPAKKKNKWFFLIIKKELLSDWEWLRIQSLESDVQGLSLVSAPYGLCITGQVITPPGVLVSSAVKWR